MKLINDLDSKSYLSTFFDQIWKSEIPHKVLIYIYPK